MRSGTHLTAIACTAILTLAAAQPVNGSPKLPQEDLGYHPVDVEKGDYYCVFEGSSGFGEPTPGDCGWLMSELAASYGSLEAYTDDVSRDGLAANFKRLVLQVRESESFGVGPNGDLLRASLLRELNAAIARVASSSSVPMDAVTTGFGVGALKNEPVVSSTIFFEGKDTQIVLREAAEYDTIGAVKVPVSYYHYATIEQAIEVRTVCSIVEAVFAGVKEGPLARVYERAASIDRGWTNYLENGYSQYPWEAVVNSVVMPKILGKYSWDNPPNEQLVFLHPELCTLIDTRAGGDGDTETALLVHGLGYVRYFGEERSWFAGLSASACFSDASPDVGYGATLHVDLAGLGMRLPNLSAGAVWFESEDGWGDPVVSVTADFWGLLRTDETRDLFFQAIR
jgi:hypothetical protein